MIDSNQSLPSGPGMTFRPKGQSFLKCLCTVSSARCTLRMVVSAMRSHVDSNRCNKCRTPTKPHVSTSLQATLILLRADIAFRIWKNRGLTRAIHAGRTRSNSVIDSPDGCQANSFNSSLRDGEDRKEQNRRCLWCHRHISYPAKAISSNGIHGDYIRFLF